MAGKKTFVAGEVLLAQDVNDFLMDQTVMNFTTVAARSSAIPTPTTGMVSYVGDTGSDSATNATIVDVPQIQAYTGSAWQNMDGLTLVAKATIGTTVSSVTMINVFSATYDAYKIIVAGGVSSADNTNVNLRFGATTSGYIYSFGIFAASVAVGQGSTSATSFANIGETDTNKIQVAFETVNPFIAQHTTVTSLGGYNTANQNSRTAYVGIIPNTTSYTDFTIIPNTGTLTGGTIYVYGYRKS
jgi:hypothetical protein